MAPNPLSNVLASTRSQKRANNYSYSFITCSNSSKTISSPGTAYCCISSTSCQSDGTCSLDYLPPGDDIAQSLTINQIPCPLHSGNASSGSSTFRNGTQSNITLTSSPSSATSSSGDDGFHPAGPIDSGTDSDPTMPLMLTYPLLILAFIIIILGGLYFFYKRQHLAASNESEMAEAYQNSDRRSRRRGWFGSRPSEEEGEAENVSNNDSTVDLALPPYEQHSWNSRWASTGRRRGGGEAGEIVEVINIRGENGENVPVAIVRNGGILCADERSLEEEKPQGLLARLKGWRLRGMKTRNESPRHTEEEGEWSVEPPEYAETPDIAVVKPEAAVCR